MRGPSVAALYVCERSFVLPPACCVHMCVPLCRDGLPPNGRGLAVWCVGFGGCGMAGTACHPAPEPRALGPLGSCACSVQTTHENIVKHQHRRPVHFFASPHHVPGPRRRLRRRHFRAGTRPTLQLATHPRTALDPLLQVSIVSCLQRGAHLQSKMTIKKTEISA